MKSQNFRNQGFFLLFLLDDGSIRIRVVQELQDLGPDPQTTTLLFSHFFWVFSMFFSYEKPCCSSCLIVIINPAFVKFSWKRGFFT
jgi:hypothetical protein